MSRKAPTFMAFACVSSLFMLSVMVSISTVVGIVTIVGWVGG